jgi:hypothetical protein
MVDRTEYCVTLLLALAGHKTANFMRHNNQRYFTNSPWGKQSTLRRCNSDSDSVNQGVLRYTFWITVTEVPEESSHNPQPGSPARACFLNRPVGNTSAFAKRQEKVDVHNCQDIDIQTFAGAVSLIMFRKGYKPAQETSQEKGHTARPCVKIKGRT